MNRKALALMAASILVFFGVVSAAAQKRQRVQTARISITRMGYEPAAIKFKRGVPARITFIRTTNDTCATEVVFPDFGIRRDLPLNEAVTVSLTPARTGEFTFTCGMRMQRGRLIVQ